MHAGVELFTKSFVAAAAVLDRNRVHAVLLVIVVGCVLEGHCLFSFASSRATTCLR